MGRIIVVANQKGGVGKTTTAINLGTCLGELGKRTLLVDVDSQSNATSGLGVDHGSLTKSIYHVMAGDATLEEILVTTPYPNLTLAPANKDLAAFQMEVTEEVEEKEYFLKKVLADARERWDYILLDLPPSLGILTINGFAAADSVLIPLQCEFYALEGIAQLMETIDMIRGGINPDLELEGVLLTMFDARTNLSAQVVAEIKQHFAAKMYNTIIPRNVRISEAPSHGQPISIYDPASVGAKSYRQFAEEFITR